VPILLQKSKVASVQISGQIPKREAINDSYMPDCFEIEDDKDGWLQ
jgi:hypothetical protein